MELEAELEEANEKLAQQEAKFEKYKVNLWDVHSLDGIARACLRAWYCVGCRSLFWDFHDAVIGVCMHECACMVCSCSRVGVVCLIELLCVELRLCVVMRAD